MAIPSDKAMKRDLRRWGVTYRTFPAIEPGLFHVEVKRDGLLLGWTSPLPRSAAIYASWAMASQEVE